MQRVEVSELGAHRAVGLHSLDDRVELGEFARQLHECIGADGLRKLRLDGGVAGKQGIESRFGQHAQLQTFRCGKGLELIADRQCCPPASRAWRRSDASALRTSSSSSMALTGPIADGASDNER